MDLSTLLSPKSVAVIGASRDPSKVGAIILKNITNSGYKGKIYPVNPQVPEYTKDIASLPEVPDLAIVALPAKLVVSTLDQVGTKGIKNVVVIASGFKESGSEGEVLENQLKETAKKYDLALLGPNCLGFVNNLLPINATFGQSVKLTDGLRFISQSGALAASLFDWFASTGLGFCEFITLGNKAVITENQILKYFLDHPLDQTKPNPIGLYLESISQGEEFIQLVSQLSRTSPIFILKPGKSPAAIRAMHSHTGSIAGEDSVLEAALEEAGVIRCKETEDFYDLARAFAWEKAPEGPKVAIISNAGGPAVISADAVSSEGLVLADFDEETKKKLSEVLPRTASVMDPVDVLGDALADRYAQATEIILSTNQADAIIVVLTPQVMTQIEKTAELISAIGLKYSKPILCAFMGGGLVAKGEEILNKNKTPSFRFPERAVKAIGAMWRWKKWQASKVSQTPVEAKVQISTERINDILAKAKLEKRNYLDNLEANEVLLNAGMSVPPTKAVADIGQAQTYAKEIKYPIVLKICSPGLLHKAESGGVIAQIDDDQELSGAWTRIEQKIKQLEPAMLEHLKIQAQKQISYGVEVIVGVRRDPTFGPVMLFGAGGALVEILEDRNLHLLPVDSNQARAMIVGSKIFPLLNGYRGEPPYAVDKLCDLMVRLASLAQSYPDISEIEINPVIVTLNDVWAVDCKIVLGEAGAKPTHAPRFKMATTLTHTILAEKFHYFVLEPEVPLFYQPGQYISVKVAGQRVNAYSIAGNVEEKKFALLIDVSPGGPGSKFFESLKVGDKISFLGPFGTFILDEANQADQILFLGTGSGISPLKSMIEHALLENNLQKPIYLYYGLRFPTDIFWKEQFEELEKKYPNFHYKLCLSKPDENWKGLTGHITDYLAKDFPDASKVAAYLCGNKPMIDEATTILTSHGCPQNRVYFEKFF